jgi:hypothetical protein
MEFCFFSHAVRGYLSKRLVCPLNSAGSSLFSFHSIFDDICDMLQFSHFFLVLLLVPDNVFFFATVNESKMCVYQLIYHVHTSDEKTADAFGVASEPARSPYSRCFWSCVYLVLRGLFSHQVYRVGGPVSVRLLPIFLNLVFGCEGLAVHLVCCVWLIGNSSRVLWCVHLRV